MGGVVSPQPSYLAGFNQQTSTSTTYNSTTGNYGSGDLGQNLLPVAMKIAAQTIGFRPCSCKTFSRSKIRFVVYRLPI
jgi:hypothetical protein